MTNYDLDPWSFEFGATKDLVIGDITLHLKVVGAREGRFGAAKDKFFVIKSISNEKHY